MPASYAPQLKDLIAQFPPAWVACCYTPWFRSWHRYIYARRPLERPTGSASLITSHYWFVPRRRLLGAGRKATLAAETNRTTDRPWRGLAAW